MSTWKTPRFVFLEPLIITMNSHKEVYKNLRLELQILKESQKLQNSMWEWKEPKPSGI